MEAKEQYKTVKRLYKDLKAYYNALNTEMQKLQGCKQVLDEVKDNIETRISMLESEFKDLNVNYRCYPSRFYNNFLNVCGVRVENDNRR